MLLVGQNQCLQNSTKLDQPVNINTLPFPSCVYSLNILANLIVLSATNESVVLSAEF